MKRTTIRVGRAYGMSTAFAVRLVYVLWKMGLLTQRSTGGV
jgi:hypothetical protein